MKKLLKTLFKIFMILAIIIALIIVISYINHKTNLSKEDKMIIPVGTQVEVNGHIVNVYSEGYGDKTLVFMSGGGTCSPVLDFKSLYSLLSDSYKIVVIEKVGYGFSEVADIDRDIDTVLAETREAISLAGITGPFVLCPHSMSGIEALYWSQLYPNEVEAIIGLDMATPEVYDEYKINLPLINLASFGAKVGLIRWFPDLVESDAIKYGTLTEDEKDQYKAIFFRRTATKTMLNEVEEIKESAKKVSDNGIPNIPVLMFSSNGQGTGWDENIWRSFQISYSNKLGNVTLIEMDCSHYIHDIEYEKIAENIRLFFESND